MSRALDVLQRIRDHARKAAEAELRRAEGERDRQRARVELVAGAIREAREGLGDQDLLGLDAYHGFRLQAEMSARREDLRLQQREREVGVRSNRHVATVREQLAVEGLLERRAEEEAREGNRKEAAHMDELGARMRRFA